MSHLLCKPSRISRLPSGYQARFPGQQLGTLDLNPLSGFPASARTTYFPMLVEIFEDAKMLASVNHLPQSKMFPVE
jgi:hypothetical protein